MKETFRKLFAEFLGTALFVFAGAGAVLAQSQGAALGYIGVALVHGVMLMAVIYAFSHISGAHINPAVTLSLFVTRHMKFWITVGYIIAQLLGSIAAALLLKNVFAPSFLMLYGGATQVSPTITPGIAILAEAIFTFALVWTVYATSIDKKSDHAGFAVGGVLLVAILVIGALTNAALNPARTFGPSLISNFWTNHFVYWVGPIIGGLIAGVLYQLFVLKKKKETA